MATRQRPQPAEASHGSRTLTLNGTEASERDQDLSDQGEGTSNVAGVLRLRGGPTRGGPRVQFDETAVDNEGMGKKKSKSLSSL